MAGNKKRKVVIFSAVGVVIALVGVGYFAVLPQVQADNYASSVKTKQSDVKAEVDKLKGLLEYDLFTSTTQTSDEVRVDIKNASEVTDAIKTKIAADGDALTEFQEYPLLSWHPAYKKALDLQAAEGSYLEAADLAVTEMEAVLKYAEDSSDILTKVESVSQTFVNEIATASTVNEIVDVSERTLAEIREAMAELDKLTPPKTYEEYHAVSVKSGNDLVKWFGDFISALKAEDAAKLAQLDKELQKNDKDLNELVGKINKEIVEESVLRTHIDAVAEADKKIAEILAES